MLRLIALLLGFGLVGAGLLVPVEPATLGGSALAGGRTLEGWWLASLGVASVLLGCLWMPAWQRAAFRVFGFVLAVAAQLTVTHPHGLQFVELRPWALEESPLRVAAWAVILLQSLWVIKTLRGALPRLRAAVPPVFARLSRIAWAALLFLLCAAHATRVFDPASGSVEAALVLQYAAQLFLAAWLFTIDLGHLAAIGAAMPGGELRSRWKRMRQVVALPGRELPPTRLDLALPWLLAGAATVASAVLCWVVLDRTPHVPDGLACLYQAECMAAGALAPAAPPVPEAFAVHLIDLVGERAFGVANPGWPAVLALGAAVGLPWLVNPLLGGLAVLLAHALTRRLADRGTAHAVALLLAASPWFLFLSASFTAHAVSLVAVLAGWVFLLQRNHMAAFAGGLCLGFVVLVSPLEGLAACALTGLWILGPGGLRQAWGGVASYALGCAAGASFVLLYNASFTGSLLAFPVDGYLDRLGFEGANRVGLGADPGDLGWTELDPLAGHGAVDAAYGANQGFYGLSFELLGWPVGSLLLAAVHLLYGRRSRTDRAAIAFVGALVALFVLCGIGGGADYGARAWYLTIVPLLWLTVRGWTTASELLEAVFPDHGARERLAATCAVLVAVGAGVFVPWRAVGKYVDYRGYHADYRRLDVGGELDGALVLVRTPSDVDYGSAFLRNAPEPGPTDPIFARDVDPETTRRLIEAYPDRPVVRVDGRAVSGKRARVTSREPARHAVDEPRRLAAREP